MASTSLYDPPRYRKNIFIQPLYRPLEQRVDWKGIMGPVRDQGDHDSCWSFAVSESIMGAMRRLGNADMTLSPQDLLDFCVARSESKTKPGHYCYANNFNGAFKYVMDQGIQREEERPYIGCSEVVPSRFRDPFNCTYIKSFTQLTSVLDVVRKFGEQPVVAHLAIFKPDFKYDHQEIYRGPCRKNSRYVDLHAVSLIDGGITEKGENYLVARLSNGPKVGEEGYVKVSVDVWIKLRNPAACSNDKEKLLFTNEHQVIFNYFCPELFSPEEQMATRRHKRARKFVDIFKEKKRKIMQI